MAEVQKTIRMPKVTLDKWLAALRSGEYEQGASFLENDGTYCCLGVLQDVVQGRTEDTEDTGGDELPSFYWLRKHSITFLGRDGLPTRNPYLTSVQSLVGKLNDDVDIEFDSGDDGHHVHHVHPFTEIADLVEAHAEAID